MDEWKLLKYLIGGALVLIGFAVAIVFLIPIGIGYIIVRIGMFIFGIIHSVLFAQKKHKPIKQDLRIMAMQIEQEQKLAKIREEPIQRPEAERLEVQEEAEELPELEEQEEIEEKPEEITFHNDFYLECKLKHEQKEALFAQGYKRLKISPHGDSGASYYWVKTRYNESKEHAFFCYLIEKELRRYTKEVELFVNSGPDVIVRHNSNVYAFDVETGKNLIKKPEHTKEKFQRYKDDYHRSYIFVTNKSLKRKYQNMGIVITRSTFRKIISRIFS